MKFRHVISQKFQTGYLEIVKLLVERGANVNTHYENHIFQENTTALQAAFYSGNFR